MDALAKVEVLDFDGFRIDLRQRSLARRGADGAARPVAIGARAFDILSLLAGRPGAIVAKGAIMNAVWPGLAVEESNLTVQVSALRRILDQDRPGPSCIQTIPGRGYRFVPEVSRPCAAPEPVMPTIPGDAPRGLNTVPALPAPAHAPGGWPKLFPAPARWSARRATAAATLAVLLAVVAALLILFLPARSPPPRMSIAVLPFSTPEGTPELAGFAEEITEDLTTDLDQMVDARVSPHQATLRFKDKPLESVRVGRELGVRYLLAGSLYRSGEVVRASVELVSGETGAALWMDQLDAAATDPVGAEDEIGGWLLDSVERALVITEAARAVNAEPVSQQRWDRVQALYERALRLVRTAPPATARCSRRGRG